MKTKNKVGRPKREPYVPVKVYLSNPHKAWIEANGGATKAIKELINQAINSDNKCHDDNICHQEIDNICH